MKGHHPITDVADRIVGQPYVGPAVAAHPPVRRRIPPALHSNQLVSHV